MISTKSQGNYFLKIKPKIKPKNKSRIKSKIKSRQSIRDYFLNSPGHYSSIRSFRKRSVLSFMPGSLFEPTISNLLPFLTNSIYLPFFIRFFLFKCQYKPAGLLQHEPFSCHFLQPVFKMIKLKTKIRIDFSDYLSHIPP